MKILIATDTYYPNVNGASYFTQRLAFSLKERGHSILVIAPSRRARHEFYNYKGIDVCGIRSIPVFVYKNFRISPPFFIKKTIKKALTEFVPDVVHLQGHFFVGKTVLSVAQDMDIPTVGTNHFMPENLLHYFHLPGAAREYLRLWSWKQFCSIFRKIDVVTTPTRTAARLLKEIGFPKYVYPISCGIDLRKFNPQNNGEYLKRRYAIPDKNILLSVGRLDKEKNIDLVLQALPLVRENIDFHFIIAGIGAEKRHLEQLVDRLDLAQYVTFTGFVPDEDLPNLYSIADCFIIAGTAELQSIVTMEAMASGLPVIAVRAMALPELVHNGENGYLFEPGDIFGIANCITRIFSNKSLRKEMTRRSLDMIRKHDIAEIITRFELLYEHVQQNRTTNSTRKTLV